MVYIRLNMKIVRLGTATVKLGHSDEGLYSLDLGESLRHLMRRLSSCTHLSEAFKTNERGKGLLRGGILTWRFEGRCLCLVNMRK